MPIITFRGEASVEALADKVYADLAESDRKKAVRALIRANPGLERLEELERGTVLRVPEIPGIRRAPPRTREDPSGEISDLLVERLAAYERDVGERFDALEKEVERQKRLLSSDQLRSALANSPDARKLAEQADEAVTREAEEAEGRRARLKTAVEKLKKDLEERR